MTFYNHPAFEAEREPGDTGRECRTCGVAVTGVKGINLTHHDEQVPLVLVPREYMPSVRQATEAIVLAMSQITNRASPDEQARAAAVALYSAGLLRTKPVKPKAGARR